jgi:hypothetical protein
MNSLILIIIAIITYVLSNILGGRIYKYICNRTEDHATAHK